jgi:hypothetical protein
VIQTKATVIVRHECSASEAELRATNQRIDSLSQKTDKRFDRLEQTFDERFQKVDDRFDQLKDSLASAKIRALGLLCIAVSGLLLYVLAHGFKWL